jgi:hypothetical protein
MTLALFAQKNSREYITLNYVHLPGKLIYDEVKTYSYSVHYAGVRNPFTADEMIQKFVALTSYAVNNDNPDLRISYNMGVFSNTNLETVTGSETKEVNGKKEKYPVYSYKYTAQYPMTVAATNTKNGIVLFQNATGAKDANIYITTSSFKSMSELNKYWSDNSGRMIKDAMAKQVTDFIAGTNSVLKNSFDFYPITERQTLFSLKRTDIANEFNGHVAKVIAILKNMTPDESVAIYKNKLKDEIAYFESLQDKFDKADKKEKVLYTSVNFNLAAVYYCIDDFDKAQQYLNRLSDVKEDESDKKWLTKNIKTWQGLLAKHLLDSRHLDYNPVTDFRLGGKDYKSDALSVAETAIKNMDAESATDLVVYSDGTEATGKVVFFEQTAEYKLVLPEKTDEPIVLIPEKVAEFNAGELQYCTTKYAEPGGLLTRKFALVHFKSDAIVLMEKLDGKLAGTKLYILQSSSQESPLALSSGVKKAMAGYLNDCDEVSKKAKDGDYGGMFTTLEKLMTLCEDYTECM